MHCKAIYGRGGASRIVVYSIVLLHLFHLNRRYRLHPPHESSMLLQVKNSS